MPHYPYQGDPVYLDQYKDLPDPRRLYAAFVSTLDNRIGQLVKYLDDTDLRRNTIVVYQSDNGHSTEERAHFGGGSSGPYRGAKFSLFEGGIRLPAIISWPSTLPQGERRDQIAHSCDWLPTLCELATVNLPEHDLDGRSLVSVLKSNEAGSPHELLIWHVGNGPKAQWAIRRGDWKLIANVQDSSDAAKGLNLSPEDKYRFLSNLSEDVGEMRNYADQQPQIVRELESIHEEWLLSTR